MLLAMGYGGAEQPGRRIGGSSDGGVDGVVDQDALGPEQVYVQAKRYAEGSSIGRETIQAFIGALHGYGAGRGVFITTSTVTQNARDCTKNI
ncbi:restriction endonuclease [Kocuria sabuli]|uniref:restriction endonuclease n=1 Tax=Kocuria sabuli TaxID=3071448 RepID=UPI0034D3ED80